jgi:predicted ArsR family transcriptional regulator
MSEAREIKKFTIFMTLVYCPKYKTIVEMSLTCYRCPFYRSDDTFNVFCAYKGDEVGKSE